MSAAKQTATARFRWDRQWNDGIVAHTHTVVSGVLFWMQTIHKDLAVRCRFIYSWTGIPSVELDLVLLSVSEISNFKLCIHGQRSRAKTNLVGPGVTW